MQGAEDDRRRAGAPGAGSFRRRRRQEQRVRGAGGGGEGEPGVGGGQGGGQQRPPAARLRRARRRRVQRRRRGAGVAGHPLRRPRPPHARPRPRLDRQRRPPRGVHLLPPRDGPGAYDRSSTYRQQSSAMHLIHPSIAIILLLMMHGVFFL